ncbi:TraR/DksA C4-type zinc finger protein [Shewanella inventionis]|uniref:Conjugal transfer protein TraR n=1 Tax=Shewanella inventionis TaxID=1738770 RepID=A0ABQ1IVI8_9GAMM|nr:TraR/DksA C4-type zinc finger protein [Shewanella inventionis]MCL1156811.1 TraR/DksA C4-type zinc finger protein [Shewanella inventionis]GGB51542.1 conjugal transfer protein TraR [Shewanella inventionis]
MHNYQDIQQKLQQLELKLRHELFLIIKDISPDASQLANNASLGDVIDFLSQVKLADTDLFTQLMKLDAALCQLDLGLYGLCSDCEMDIESTRLNTDPTEQRCSSCQQKYLNEHRLELRLNH